MIPLALAGVFAVCPAYEAGEPFPVPAHYGCPVPVSGWIYPDDHKSEDESAQLALDRSAVALRECADDLDDASEGWSPAVWIVLGAAAGAVAGYELAK